MCIVLVPIFQCPSGCHLCTSVNVTMLARHFKVRFNWGVVLTAEWLYNRGKFKVRFNWGVVLTAEWLSNRGMFKVRFN